MKILIIGGYGTFGRRIVRLLDDQPGLEIVIGGRSLTKATRFAKQLSGSTTTLPCQFDRDGDLDESLRCVAPDLIIDASGPFQSYGENPYRVVKASIANAIHYLDLADDPEYVMGISQFDGDAREAGVFVLAGVSTCPALTGAIFRRISRDFATVEQVTGGIAPSPYSGVGLSVIRAIAAYAGQARTVRERGKTVVAFPVTETRRFTIAPPGQLALRSLNYSLVDVPDLHLLGDIEPRAESIWFGAAPVPAVFHAGLRLLAKAVKRGLISTLAPLAPLMYGVMGRFGWGEHRGGLFLECRGIDLAGHRRRRSWHLLAEGSIGPMTPALASVAIVKSWLAGLPPASGARAAHSELELEAFEPMFRSLDVQFGEREDPLPADWPLLRRLLGGAWTSLPQPVAAVHDISTDKTYSGRATVTRGRSIIARVTARLVGFPLSGEYVPVTVDMHPQNGQEIWTRNFDGHRFSSTLSEGKGRWVHLLCERFGIVRFGISLILKGGHLHYEIRRWSVAGIPMPLFLRPKGAMYESVRDGRFEFNVEITLPLLGHIVTYKGWLEDSD